MDLSKLSQAEKDELLRELSAEKTEAENQKKRGLRKFENGFCYSCEISFYGLCGSGQRV
jgi:hypothetical protein